MPSAFDRFAQLIYQQCGTRLKSDKRNLLITRLRHRLRHHGFPEDDLGLEAYWEVVEREIKSPTTTPSKNSLIESPDGFLSGPGKTTPESSLEEIPAIIDAITTQETYFERTPAAFEWFSRDFLGRMISSEGTASIIESGPQQPKILIWSAACSIGAEVYSLAARLLADAHPALLGRIQLQGSDICRIAIERARDPAYSPRLAKGVDPDLRDRLFEPRQSDDGNYIVRRCLRERVHFFVHNLLDKPPLKNVDVCFCKTY
ncbi:MAG: CheR family methyltransferase [Planctomycetota bacterium]